MVENPMVQVKYWLFGGQKIEFGDGSYSKRVAAYRKTEVAKVKKKKFYFFLENESEELN